MCLPEGTEPHGTLFWGESECFKPREGVSDGEATLVDTQFCSDSALGCVPLGSKVCEHRREGLVEASL